MICSRYLLSRAFHIFIRKTAVSAGIKRTFRAVETAGEHYLAHRRREIALSLGLLRQIAYVRAPEPVSEINASASHRDKPQNTFRSVLLPEPFSPTMQR